ncbi:MAG: CFI-box-CTERM domain-containing protein, partial [Thermodesulfobacteriota bacterium]|nr:CFI-box-CTERM domain-containing protein [Thermodesulfobacteriota bacterium]
NNLGNTVSVISSYTLAVMDTIEVGAGPWGAVTTYIGDYLYVVNNGDNSVSKINTLDYTDISSLTVGASPVALGAFVGGKPPEAPSDLTATVISDKQIDLSWTDNSSDEFGFKLESKKGSHATYAVIAELDENVTSYSHTGLSYNRIYYYRVASYNDASRSDYSTEVSATTEDDDSDCFVATAVYGASLSQHTRVLRAFRDTFLLTNSMGRIFVDFYYNFGPRMASFIAEHDLLRTIVRWGLLPFVGFCWVALKVGPVPALVLMILSLTLMSLAAVVLLRIMRSKNISAEAGL